MRYVKCLGGPRGREGILVACRDGRVLKVFVNNAFPCHVWRHPRPIRYADISVESSGLAVIDDESKLTVINLLTGVVRNLFGSLKREIGELCMLQAYSFFTRCLEVPHTELPAAHKHLQVAS